MHFEFLVEEPSSEAALMNLIPHIQEYRPRWGKNLSIVIRTASRGAHGKPWNER